MSSHNKIRIDKTCLNCRQVVEKRFCPNCGQENTETRKTFYHLFVHFFEDLTHYENSFWKTIRNLLFKPGSLTKEYLSGKRMSYLAPVRLYIFISFVTFLGMILFVNKEPVLEEKYPDSIVIPERTIDLNYRNYELKNTYSLDSIHQNKKEHEKISDFEYKVLKKYLSLTEKNTPQEIGSKFTDAFFHNLPKFIIFYMPVFAFILWIFHSKKKWYYFDHGIFTLHYFSFLLLLLFILDFVDFSLNSLGYNSFTSAIYSIMKFLAGFWILYYFFPAHHRFYNNPRWKTILKGILIFFANVFLFSIFILSFTIYLFLNLK